jgi:hypothetical protein
MPTGHSAEEQQDQYPTNELKLDHWYFPYATMPFSSRSRGYQPPFNIA